MTMDPAGTSTSQSPRPREEMPPTCPQEAHSAVGRLLPWTQPALGAETRALLIRAKRLILQFHFPRWTNVLCAPSAGSLSRKGRPVPFPQVPVGMAGFCLIIIGVLCVCREVALLWCVLQTSLHLQPMFHLHVFWRRGASPVAQWLRIRRQRRRCKRWGVDPWVWKIPWRRKWPPIQDSCREKSHAPRSLAGSIESPRVRCDSNRQECMHAVWGFHL